MVIDKLCTNVATEKMDTRSVTETVEVEGLVVEVVVVHKADGRVAGVAGIDDGLD